MKQNFYTCTLHCLKLETVQRMNSFYYSQAREYYKAIKMNKLQLLTRSWKNIPNITLSKKRKAKKTTHSLISLK